MTTEPMLCPEGHFVKQYRNPIPNFSTWILYKLGVLVLKFKWPSYIYLCLQVEGKKYYVMSCKNCRKLYFDYQCTAREVEGEY